ncbi:MAG: carboxy terminal-processing peptidase [Pseudomonadales bacterium]|nr:carboxy terminal-processing peptidase [Pseudomonadales bacterium]
MANPIIELSPFKQAVIMQYHQVLRSRLGLGLVVASLLLGVNAPSYSLTLKPESEQRVASIEITKKLQQRHYEKRDINKNLSYEFFDSYMQSVDGNKQIFTQNEVETFKNHFANSMATSLTQGKIDPAFDIFNSYQNKLVNRLEQQIEALPQQIKTFDFNKDDSLILDRSELAWPKNQDAIDLLWHKRLKSAVLSMQLQDKKDDEILDLLSKRYKNQLKRINKLNAEDVFQMYMNAFTTLYDPHTNYLSPSNSKNFDISMSLKLEGIGAMLRMKDEYTQVVRLIHAGPAAKQGQLSPSDKIVGVAQDEDEMVDVIGWRLDEVVNLIRGKKGSIVRLEVIPANSKDNDSRNIISIVRDEVKLEEQAVQKAMLDIKDEKGMIRKIGVLDIPAFYIDFEALRNRDPNYKSTTRDTAKLLTELVNDGAEGIIIDLRNNGGGSLREANELTGLFIDKGPSVQIKLSDQRVYQEAKRQFSPYYEGPVIVLINRMSASASEIFAGALQDYGRAIIVGSGSYGKGTVQSLTPLSHGKLKVTESKFYRISGDSTQERGVLPDVKLPGIYDREVIGESALDKAMKWDQIAPAINRKFNDYTGILSQLQKKTDERAAKDPDFIYFNDKIAFEKSLDAEILSLNKDKREKLARSSEEKSLVLINKRRKGKGEATYKTFASMEEALTKEADEKSAKGLDSSIDVKDPFLQESAHVLLDSKNIMQGLKLAN